ncbi:MAG: sulfur carrier protein ThiS [Acidiferrobacteraceae bacterium]
MKITVNGCEQELESPATIALLVSRLGLSGGRIAVEVNREIVPRSAHGTHELRDHDRVEIVGAVGGG